MLVLLRPWTAQFINDPSKLARCDPGVEADWSPIVRALDNHSKLACASSSEGSPIGL